MNGADRGEDFLGQQASLGLNGEQLRFIFGVNDYANTRDDQDCWNDADCDQGQFPLDDKSNYEGRRKS